MSVQFNFGQVEAILATMNRIADGKRVAFRARLKHFQRLGFPPGVNTGTGRKAAYSFTNLMQMVVALELTQAGISPARVVKIVLQNWSEIRFSLLICLTPDRVLEEWDPSPDPNLALVLRPEALRELTQDGEPDYIYYEAVEISPIADLADVFVLRESAPLLGEQWRVLVLSVRHIALMTLHYVAELAPGVSPTAIYESVRDEILEHQRELEAVGKALDLNKVMKEWRKRRGDSQEA